jgi:heterotetrameric sarcosine oxidase gamma subunit
VSLEFLCADAVAREGSAAPLARSPMERSAAAAGASFETRDGWNVAVSYGSVQRESQLAGSRAGWADVSHLGKLELQAAPDEVAGILAAAGGEPLELGRATRAADAWWCPVTPRRVLVLCEPGAVGALRERLGEAADGAGATASVTDVSTVFAAMTLVGPLAREVFARFCALDLRDQATPVGALRPGSIARQPGLLIREAQDRFLFLFGWAVGQYVWTVVKDAAEHLGGGPIGLAALEALPVPAPEVSSRA